MTTKVLILTYDIRDKNYLYIRCVKTFSLKKNSVQISITAVGAKMLLVSELRTDEPTDGNIQLKKQHRCKKV